MQGGVELVTIHKDHYDLIKAAATESALFCISTCMRILNQPVHKRTKFDIQFL